MQRKARRKNLRRISEEEGFQLLGKQYHLPEFEEEDVELGELTRLNTSRVTQYAEEIPTQLQVVGVLVAKAKKLAKIAELNYKVWWAKRDAFLRKRADQKKKKTTEKDIESAIRRSKNYIVMRKRQIDAEELADNLDSTYWALQAKSKIIAGLIAKEGSLSKLSNLKMREE